LSRLRSLGPENFLTVLEGAGFYVEESVGFFEVRLSASLLNVEV
jgi:hypothetical protein